MFSGNIKDAYSRIEDIVWKYDISYLDAVIQFCEENSIEIETIASELKKNQKLVSSIQIEAEDLNYLPRTSRIEF